MIAAAAALGLVIGVVVGGLGGGGGVLTVPVLVYVLGQDAQDATTGSVIIVGISAAAGALARVRGGIDWRTGAALGGVGIPAALLGTLLNQRVDQAVLLLAFAGLTLVSAAAMLLDARSGRRDGEGTGPPIDLPPVAGATRTTTRRSRLGTAVQVLACGTVIGFLTGFLGVGGGFLVVPALVVVLRKPMALAIGTSLLVIALNSVSSIASRLDALHLDWSVVLPFTAAAVLGTVAGKKVGDRLSGATLTRSFAAVLIAVGGFVAVHSLVVL